MGFQSRLSERPSMLRVAPSETKIMMIYRVAAINPEF
jgi:hypothetical protein